jgi:hypothetical protein
VANLPLFDKLPHGPGYLFDGPSGINPMLVEEVDDVAA